MDLKPFILFLSLLCSDLNLTWSMAYQGELCPEKAAIFDQLTRRLRHALTAERGRNSLICQKLSRYISHALYTKNTCPDLPLVNNSTFLNTVALMRSDFQTRCNTGDYNIVVYPCSPAMVHYLVTSCNRFIDQVQFYMPRLEVCDISKNLIACHEELLDECRHSPLLEQYHIVESLRITQDSLDFLCDESLADEPWENGPEHRRSVRSLGSISRILSPVLDLDKRAKEDAPFTERSAVVVPHSAREYGQGAGDVFDQRCPEEIKLGRSVSEVCFEEQEEKFPNVSLESGFTEICRVFDFMHDCATNLYERCKHTTTEQDKNYFFDNFQTVYDAYGCGPPSTK